jgi:hypothetical protein
MSNRTVLRTHPFMLDIQPLRCEHFHTTSPRLFRIQLIPGPNALAKLTTVTLSEDHPATAVPDRNAGESSLRLK